MVESESSVLEYGALEVKTLPDRSGDMPILTQGPMTRFTLWKEIVENHGLGKDANQPVKGHYFEESGLLLIDLHNGERQ